MTPAEIELIERLIVGLRTTPLIPRDEFLREFGATDGVELGKKLVWAAADDRSPDDLAYALVVLFNFGTSPDLVDLLCGLTTADWHCRHEDVVSLIGDVGTPRVVPALWLAAQWVPECLAFDSARAMARKAVHALGRIEGVEATHALEALTGSPSEIVALGARKRLAERAAR